MNKKRYHSIILASIGIISGIIYSFTYGKPKAPKSDYATLPASSSFSSTISGVGIVESSCRNIIINSQNSGLISKLLVKPGDNVKAGEVLFEIDDSLLSASLAVKEKALEAAEARLKLAKATLEDQADQFARLKKLETTSVVSLNTLLRKSFDVKRATAEVASSEALVESSKAELNQANVLLNQLYVKAPFDGIILKTYIKPGEYINTLSQNSKAILMGCNGALNLRVQIDENELWRFSPSSEAKAFLRSNKDISFPLKLISFEPYVQPKQQLNGDLVERVDTRTLDAVYQIETKDHNLYIGQLLDVFIDGK